MKKILMLLLSISLFLHAAQKSKADEIDHLALAALLLKDGHLGRANEEFKAVNTEDKNLDFVRYYTIGALIATKQERYEEANRLFSHAISAGQEDKSVYLYMAQNSFKLEKYEDVLASLKAAGESANEPSAYALKAEAEFRLGRSSEALSTLSHAIKRFAGEYGFYKQRFGYLISLELYQSALEDASFYLNNAQTDEKTSIAFVNAFAKAKQTKKAIELGEKLKLQYPSNATIIVQLAHLYITNEMIQAAADLFDQASNYDEKYTQEAAEMLRRAKEFVLALYKNSQMLDTSEKLKQRIAIYLEYGAYEQIVVSHAALKRSGLLEDETIRYALAYSYYMVGEFSACENELKKLTKPDLFQKATEIRKSIQKCKEEKWECEL